MLLLGRWKGWVCGMRVEARNLDFGFFGKKREGVCEPPTIFSWPLVSFEVSFCLVSIRSPFPL